MRFPNLPPCLRPADAVRAVLALAAVFPSLAPSRQRSLLTLIMLMMPAPAEGRNKVDSNGWPAEIAQWRGSSLEEPAQVGREARGAHWMAEDEAPRLKPTGARTERASHLALMHA